MKAPEKYYVLLNTTKPEKIFHLNRAAQILGLPLVLVPITVLGEPAHAADEDKKTYTGNLADKVRESADYLAAIIKSHGEDYVYNCLGIKNREREKIIIAAEDSGIGAAPLLIDGEKIDLGDYLYKNIDDPEFAEFKNLLESIKRRGLYEEGKKFPGVETVHVIPALGGVANFAKLLRIVAEKLGFSYQPEPGRNPNDYIKVLQSSMIGGFIYQPGMDLTKEVEVLGYKSSYQETLSLFALTGDMSKLGEVDIDNICIPQNMFESGVIQTRYQLGGKYNVPEARANALEELASTFGIGSKPNQIKVRLPNVKDFNVALIGKTSGRVAQLLKTNLKTGSGYGQIVGMNNWPDDIHLMEKELLDENDCFVFMPLPKEMSEEDRISHLLRLAYVLVHKAVDPEGKAKPVIIWDPENTYKPVIDDLVLMFNRGVYAEKLSNCITFVTKPERAELRKAITEARKGYYRVPSDPKDHDQEVPKFSELAQSKFNVAIFCSATMEGHFQEKAEELAYDCFEAGYGVVWGAGDRHMMGGVYEAYKTHAAGRTNDLSLEGSTTKNIAVTETESGKGIAGLPNEFRASTISKRLQFLMQSDAFVFMEGGAGTLQELLTLAYYRKQYPEEFANKPIILHETALNGDPLIFQQAFKDLFGVDMEKASPDRLSANHIYIAKSSESVKTILSYYGANFTRGMAQAAA